MESYCSKDLGGDANPLPAYFPTKIADTLSALDVNKSKNIPMELLRCYVEREEEDVMNSLITAVFWCICRAYLISPRASCNATAIDNKTLAEEIRQASHRICKDVCTRFQGNPQEYMLQFSQDVGSVLNTIPLLNSSVVSGMPTDYLSPEVAHGIVSAATKLDPSARNGLLPLTSCVWHGMHPS